MQLSENQINLLEQNKQKSMSGRHYGLKVGQRVAYNPGVYIAPGIGNIKSKKRLYVVVGFDGMDNNRVLLKELGKKKIVSAVAEWCKKI